MSDLPRQRAPQQQQQQQHHHHHHVPHQPQPQAAPANPQPHLHFDASAQPAASKRYGEAFALYGGVYGAPQSMKDRAELAFQQSFVPRGNANVNANANASTSASASGAHMFSPAQYAGSSSGGFAPSQLMAFGLHEQPQTTATSVGLSPQLTAMTMQSHEASKHDPDGARKFRSLSEVYLGSPSAFGAVQQSSQHHQHQQQQQQQASAVGERDGISAESAYLSMRFQSVPNMAGYRTGPPLMQPSSYYSSQPSMPQSMGVSRLLPPSSMAVSRQREYESSLRITQQQQHQQQHTPQQQQQQPPSSNQSMHTHQQEPPTPTTAQDVLCSFCYAGQCDRVADGCGHRFHFACLQAWGEKSMHCPLCMPSANPIQAVSFQGRHDPPHSHSVSLGYQQQQQPQQQHLQHQQYVAGQAFESLEAIEAHNRSIAQFAASSASASMSSARPRLRTHPRPPPIDTTRVTDAVPVPKISSTGGNRKGATSSSSAPQQAMQLMTPTPSSRPTSATSSAGSADEDKRGGGAKAKSKKPLKECSIPGCGRTVRSRGLCKGHGGGRRCGFPNCGLSDQGGGFCISHGGGKRCQQDGCENSAQSRGLCKLHGGGSRCTVPNCTKSSQGRGLCRAHGGGRRCMVEGCNKTDRRAGFCVTHGADKKCAVAECSKTGRIDGLCTKHYFERHQELLTTTMTPRSAGASRATAKDDRASKRKRAPSARSKLTPAASPTTPTLLSGMNAVSLAPTSSSNSSHVDATSGSMSMEM
ncbi:hypothetical protein ATCC90586_002842 [Pythium insidiosum]|nr:hypothetical protein ATCC90586_002842 [Pythium insidiosum]